MTEYIEITLSDHVWPNHSFINLYIVVILVKISNANNINGGGGDGLFFFVLDDRLQDYVVILMFALVT